MIGSRCTNRIVAMAVVALLVAAATACGDDDGSSANPERFCEINAELEQQGDPFELPPDEAREAAREFQDLIDEAVTVAPDEIRSSVEVVADSFTPVLDLLEAADFDVAQVDEAELEALFDAAFSDEGDDAGAAMDEWIAASCSA